MPERCGDGESGGHVEVMPQTTRVHRTDKPTSDTRTYAHKKHMVRYLSTVACVQTMDTHTHTLYHYVRT